jgi:hypothetical protein
MYSNHIFPYQPVMNPQCLYAWRIEVYDCHLYRPCLGDWSEYSTVHTDTPKEEEALDLYIRTYGSKTEHYSVDGYKRFFITISTVHGCTPIGMYAKEHAALGRRIFLKFKI